MAQRYKALNGISWGNRRLFVGDIADDIPPRDIAWLVADGHLAPVDDDRPKGRASKAPEPQPEPASGGDD